MPSSVLLALSNTQTTWLINWPLFLSGLCFQLAQWLTFPKVSVGLQCRHACFHFVWTTTQNVTLKGMKGSKLQGIWMLWSYLPSWSFCGVLPWTGDMSMNPILGWTCDATLHHCCRTSFVQDGLQGCRHLPEGCGHSVWLGKAGLRLRKVAGASVHLISLLRI